MRARHYQVVLTDEQRTELLLLTRQGCAPAFRGHILPYADEDSLDQATAAVLYTSVNTVQRALPALHRGGAGTGAVRPFPPQRHAHKGKAPLVVLAYIQHCEGRTFWTYNFWPTSWPPFTLSTRPSTRRRGGR